MLNLTLAEKGGETKHLTFEKEEVVLGRVQGNDIVLPKGNVSKKHCRIFVEGARFQVQDLGSTNGTYVNGRKIGEATVVSASDKIYVGDYIVKVENAAAEPAAPSGPPEAGSLSTAIPRRPPPPPPRHSNPGLRAVEDEEVAAAPALPPPPPSPKGKSAGRATLPPPPPPPRRDTFARPSAALEDDLDAPPSPGEVDLDEEAMTKPPKLAVPPLKSALASLTANDDEIDDRAESADAKTASKGRAILPAGPDGIPAGADAIASWLGQQIASDGVTGITVGPATVEIERAGKRELVANSEGKPLAEALRSLAGRGTPRPSADAAAVDVALADGARLRALFPPAVDAACGTLFPPAKPARSLGDLVAAAAISKELRELLEACLSTGRNLLVAGDGHSALALMGALAGALPEGSRVISLLPGLAGPPGRLVTVTRDARLPDPHALAAGLRPDLLFVSIDDAALAAWVVTQATAGGTGIVAMIQGRSAADAMARLAALGAAGLGGSGHARELLAASFDAAVHIARLADGNLRVTEMAEPRVDAGGALAADTIVAFKNEGAGGRFQAAPNSRLAATLAARGTGPGRR